MSILPLGATLDNRDFEQYVDDIIPSIIGNFEFPDGTVTEPGVRFVDSTNTGMYRDGTELAFAQAGSKMMGLDTTSIDVFEPMRLDYQGGAAMMEFRRSDDLYNVDLFVDSANAFHIQQNSGATNTFLEVSSGGQVVSRPTSTAITNIDVCTLVGDGASAYDFLHRVRESEIRSFIPHSFANGSAATPSISAGSDKNTGFYFSAADEVSVSTGGVARVQVGTTDMTSFVPIFNQTGTSALPAYTFEADPDTGMYRRAADSIGFSTGGVERAQVNTADITTTVPFFAANGTAAAPVYTFSGDPDTGMYSAGTNEIAFSTDGVARFQVNTADITSFLPIFNQTGTSALPAYTFEADPDTGMSRRAANSIGFSTEGIERLQVNTTNITSKLPVFNQNGTAAAPAISFESDPDTGVYRVAADTMAFTTNGVLRSMISDKETEFEHPIIMNTYATGSYPAGTTMGGIIHSSTLTRPLYFDGTDWKDFNSNTIRT